jgi:16S rRNA (cytosine967-C5)-methyltransferase
MAESRSLVVRILARIETGKAYADAVLDAELRKSGLERRDRALATELVYGVLRWRRTLDWYLDQVCRKPMRNTSPWLRRILRLGCYQLLFLDKIPPSAAINESVKLAGAYSRKIGLPAKTAKGFVNAALRQLDRTRSSLQTPDTLADPVARLATAYSYPDWMIQRWMTRLGEAETEAACQRHNTPPPLTVRVNSLTSSCAVLLPLLQQQVASVMPLPGRLPGLSLSGHPPLTELPGYDDGFWTVQNAASMLIPLIVGPQPGEAVLDACAGSGTKTTQLGELMQNQGQIIAIDQQAGKLRKLRENCQRLGITIVQTVCDDVTHFVTAQSSSAGFDRILIDAPCSGFGVLRRHPDAKWTKQPGQIADLAGLQLRLLRQIAPALRPGGVLVYSVCTTEPEETDGVVEQFLDSVQDFRVASPLASLPEEAHTFVSASGYLRIEPPQPLFDGFFCAKLRRR